MQDDFIEAAERVRVKTSHEATHHAHKRALVLTARKLLGVVYGMLTRGPIDDERQLMPQSGDRQLIPHCLPSPFWQD